MNAPYYSEYHYLSISPALTLRLHGRSRLEVVLWVLFLRSLWQLVFWLIVFRPIAMVCCGEYRSPKLLTPFTPPVISDRVDRERTNVFVVRVPPSQWSSLGKAHKSCIQEHPLELRLSTANSSQTRTAEIWHNPVFLSRRRLCIGEHLGRHGSRAEQGIFPRFSPPPHSRWRGDNADWNFRRSGETLTQSNFYRSVPAGSKP